jgi:hypothetical protein
MKKIFYFLGIFISTNVWSQSPLLINSNELLGSVLNPATAGSSHLTRFHLQTRWQQMVDGSTLQNYLAYFSKPLYLKEEKEIKYTDGNMNIGGFFNHKKLEDFSISDFSLQMNYKLAINDQNFVRFGLSSIYNYTNVGSDYFFGDQIISPYTLTSRPTEENVIVNNAHLWKIGFGILFTETTDRLNDWWVGLSGDKALSGRELSNERININTYKPRWSIQGGYNWKLKLPSINANELLKDPPTFWQIRASGIIIKDVSYLQLMPSFDISYCGNLSGIDFIAGFNTSYRFINWQGFDNFNQKDGDLIIGGYFGQQFGILGLYFSLVGNSPIMNNSIEVKYSKTLFPLNKGGNYTKKNTGKSLRLSKFGKNTLPCSGF